MRAFNNLPLLAKLAIPTVILVSVAAGLVWLATASLATLDRTTQAIIDVKATRAVMALQMNIAVDEATIAEKSIIIETSEAAMQKQLAGYKEHQTTALAAIDRLIALADTPERRAANEGIRADLVAFFAAADRSIAYGLKNDAETDIGAISRIIDEMSNYASSIAAAMEEQGAATQEITRNVQEAAQGTEQVTTNISGVREGAGQTGAAATQVLGAAQELARHSEDLTREVRTFLTNVKAA